MLNEAEMFEVVKSTIYRVTHPEAAKRYDKKRKYYGVYQTKEELRAGYKKFKKRKNVVQPKVKKYRKLLNKEYRRKIPEKVKKWYKNWYSKKGKKYYGLKRGYKKYKLKDL